jgi:hypothetical protein
MIHALTSLISAGSLNTIPSFEDQATYQHEYADQYVRNNLLLFAHACRYVRRFPLRL